VIIFDGHCGSSILSSLLFTLDYTSCISKVFVTARMIQEGYSKGVGIISKNIVISCVLYKSVLCGMLY